MSGVLCQVMSPTHLTDGLRDVVTLKHKHCMCQYRYVEPAKCHHVMSGLLPQLLQLNHLSEGVCDVMTLKHKHRMCQY